MHCLPRNGWAQGITLPASGTYTETFDNISAGLPAGWTVRTGATTSPPNLGTEAPLATAPAAWNEVAAGFKNVASADGLAQTANASEQAVSTDRALGVRQADTFGDPGAAFMLQIANTIGVSNLNLKFKIQSLDVSASRTTTWRVEYGLGQTPLIYFQVGASFTTGGSTFSNVEIPLGLPNLSSNSGPVRIRIVANSPSSGSGERPTTAIDDVTLTYSTTPDLRFSQLSTFTYSEGGGPATQDFSIQGYYLTGAPGMLTISSAFSSAYTFSRDGVNFAPSITVPYTDANSLLPTIKVRLVAGLPAGTYRSILGVNGSGLSYGSSLGGIVTQIPNQPVTDVSPASLTGTNGFTYDVGFGPVFKSLEITSANLTGAPGSYTITSSNPAAFQLVGSDNQLRGTTTVNYNNSNPGFRAVTVGFLSGLSPGVYTADITIQGGGAPPVTIPVSGTVSTNNPPSLSVNPSTLTAFSTAEGSPSAPQSFTIVGRNFGAGAQLSVAAPAGFEVSLLNSIVYFPNPAISVGSGNFDIQVRVRMTGAAVGSFSGNVVIKTGAITLTLPVTGTVNAVGTQPLSVTAVSYNCQTGALTFGRLGGDPNRAVEYEAIGVKSYSTNPNGVIEAEKRNDPNSGTTVTMKARYVGDPSSEVTYVFDFGAYCTGGTTPTPTALQLIEPLYNCQTGAITFRSQGGDGTPIEYGAIGIKPFSTNPNGTIEAEKRGDPNSGTTVELKARQSGVEVSYVFDFAAYCRSQNGRQAARRETVKTLQVNVLGNPVGDELTVEVNGVVGKPLQLRLSDVRGNLIEQRNLPTTANGERQIFNVNHQKPGLLFLQAVSGEQMQTVKVLKP